MNWVFFPLILPHTSCILYLLIFHMARSIEVQEGCNTLQLCDWCPKGTGGSTRSSRQKRLSHHLSKPATSVVSATVISITSGATTYSVHLWFFHYELLSKSFVFGAGTLWKASVHVILSDQRQKKSGFSTIHQIPFGPENFTVVLCQATMPAFSKISEDNSNRNCILRILLNDVFPSLSRIKI